MKILTIAATPFFSDRGCHIRIYNEAKYLKKLGAQVRLCTYHLGRDIAELDIIRIKGPRWYRKISPGFHWGKIWLDFKLLLLCRREIKNFQPDAIHAHLYEGLAIGYLAKKLAFEKIPIVFELQGDIEEEFESYNREKKIAGKIFTWVAKKIVRWADYVVVSSENVFEKVSQFMQKRSEISLIRDGVDFDLLEKVSGPNSKEEKGIRELKKWKRDAKMLMYAGGLSDSKGVKVLLEAFFDFVLVSQRWKLALLGYGCDEEKYKQFVKEKNMEDFIALVGRVDYFSLPYYLTCADAVIDPKKESSESSGKLMTYMVFNLPIICFENHFNSARLRDKGFYLKSINDLGNTLLKIESIKSVQYNLENWSEEKEVKKLYDIFKSTIKKMG